MSSSIWSLLDCLFIAANKFACGMGSFAPNMVTMLAMAAVTVLAVLLPTALSELKKSAVGLNISLGILWLFWNGLAYLKTFLIVSPSVSAVK